jgi:hypothetical protein
VKEKWIKKERKSNEIELILNIQDIYRVDISCEFITEHLSSRISDKYKNTKKCSLFSSFVLNNSKFSRILVGLYFEYKLDNLVSMCARSKPDAASNNEINSSK